MRLRVLAGLVLAMGIRGWAEDQAALQERMRRAAELTSLDGAGMQPWHLKLNVETFDGAGKSQGKDSIEEWWASPTLYRVVYTKAGSSVTMLENSSGAYLTKGAGLDGNMLLMKEQAVHPMPPAEQMEDRTLELRTESFGTTKFDCLVLAKTRRGMPDPPLGYFPTYCMNVGQDSVRVTYTGIGHALIRDRIVSFLSKDVALELRERSGNKTLAQATIEILKTAVLSEADFTAGPELDKLGATPVRVLQRSLVKLEGGPPMYPTSAKQRHLSGKVILHVLLGRDGRVLSVNAIPPSNPELAASAIEAVRKWRYKPYLLRGGPVEVDTTVTVNFDINIM